MIALLVIHACLVAFAAASRAAITGAPQLPLIPGHVPGLDIPSEDAEFIEFRLKNIFHHGTSQYPGLHRRLDVHPEAQVWLHDDEHSFRELLQPMLAQPRQMTIQRLRDRSPERMNALLDIARITGQRQPVPDTDWTVDEIPGPNVTSKKTLQTLGRVALNAYVHDAWTGDWEDVKGGFNYTEDFGWEMDGLRGHIFADTENKTVIIGIKGTSMAVFDGAGSTTNDKQNDNLFFGCCCGQGSWLTYGSCDCETSTYTCNSTCVTKALREKNRYYYASQEIYHNVTALYPEANIWIIGHSLGGSTGSLLGMTYGLPTVTFEAPGEAMAASRLGLPTPPGYHVGDNEHSPTSGTFHFGNNGDPLFMGTCGSTCYLGGYAMESVCHSGMECVYNTTGDLGWGSHLTNHLIKTMVHSVIDVYNETAKCEVVRDCTDCFNWKYYESNSSSSTTTRSSFTSATFTQTRTQTCQTPGWWGCLDETTTTTGTQTSTSTKSTSTCKTPGWFGCLDEKTTTTSTSSSSTSRSSPSTTCETPGRFWGCRDEPVDTRDSRMPTITTTSSAAASTTEGHSSSTATCKTPGLIWGCRDKTTASPGHKVTQAIPLQTQRPA